MDIVVLLNLIKQCEFMLKDLQDIMENLEPDSYEYNKTYCLANDVSQQLDRFRCELKQYA